MIHGSHSSNSGWLSTPPADRRRPCGPCWPVKAEMARSAPIRRRSGPSDLVFLMSMISPAAVITTDHSRPAICKTAFIDTSTIYPRRIAA